MDAVRDACPRIQRALEEADERRRSELRIPSERHETNPGE
jgi:hypothetical protein